MNVKRTTRIRLAALGALALPLVLACGGGSDDAGAAAGERSADDSTTTEATDDGPLEGTSQEGEPEVPIGDTERAQVSWDGDELVVVVPGSSSCPAKARDLEVVDDGTWVIDVTPKVKPNEVCTMDLVPARSRVEAPADATAGEQVTVVLVEGKERSEPIEVGPAS